MTRYDTHSLSQYLDSLAAREPVPGGGSAAALCGALGAGLIQMVAKYSLGKGKPADVETRLARIDREAGEIRSGLLTLVSRDAEAYLEVVAARKKDEAARKAAAVFASQVPQDIREAAEKGLFFIPYLRKEGNPYLQADVDAAEEFLKAATHVADVMIKANS